MTAPLRAAGRATTPRSGVEDPRVADLEARKEAKYREIRDAELDHAQGKLSEEDWARRTPSCAREAIEILTQLDAARRPARNPPAGTRAARLPRRGNVLSESVQVVIAIILIFLVLLHSRRRTRASPAPSASARRGSSLGGGSLVERNLDRWTIFFAILFVLNTIVLLKI